ncbi:50S ribosomal protein L25 [Clostridium sp. SM-530-WT-3G]|uniref:50S ribosomal protein L25 n=1 Tax=Clostridium sp. SM-530-WT-3G TaxID=2725303 RepID=UPI00145DBBE0|nr:50S ribosomal protein L25 [Clostridium sp. SM-530-WT-3G]NME82395.1 50S ribosomal protein L25 [Clostridium sp. SM-530-WT-3G]
MEELVLNKRLNNVTHGAKKVRKKGKIPGILYGKKLGNLMFEIGEMDLIKEVESTGQHGVVSFDIDGYSGTALIKEIQKDPITHKPMHVDLEEIYNGKEVVTEIPIKYHGKEFLEKKGVILQTQKDYVKVSGKPEYLPKFIDLDVSGAATGSVYTLADLEIASEISIVDELQSVCASVVNEQFITSGEEDDDGNIE